MSRDAFGRWAGFVAVLCALLGCIGVATSALESDEHEIMVVTWRGCEDACQGLLDYLDASAVNAKIVLRDADTNRDVLPDLVEEVNARRPDLLVTWGTSVTVGMLGTVDGQHDDTVTGIPSVFMIVADPVGAGVVKSHEESGRTWITGTRNRAPEQTQMRVLAGYRPFDRLGVLYNDDELNAVLNVDEVRQVAQLEGFDVVERVIESDKAGDPLVDDIDEAVADLARSDVDYIYVGSSSFLLANADHLTRSALAHGLPLATAYESMVRESDALFALASPYYNVGQLAGRQVERIFVDGAEPGSLPIVGLDRFTLIINIETARKLDMYPPMLMLKYAEIVGRPDGEGL